MSASRQRPNVLVFFTDQQRWDTAGCYGNPMGLTPALDELAGRSLKVERAFTCQPVCGPARACLQTGRFATAAGVWHNDMPLPAEHPTLAQCFNRAGYDTGYVGKWHLSGTVRGPVKEPQRGGYRYWRGADVLEAISHPCDGIIYDNDNRPLRLKGYRVDAVTNLAMEFLRQDRANPFFLFVSILEPHHQNDLNHFVAPDGYADRCRNMYVPPDLARLGGDWPGELAEYYGACRRIDECFDRLMEELRRQGQLENTIILFTSDHGCHFRTRNSEYKRSCHEASIRIPMVWAGPGFENAGTIDRLVSLVDIPPTLLSAAGLEVPPSMQGRDMMKLLQDRQAAWEEEVFVQISEDHVGRAIRTDRWKYCAVAPDRNGWKDIGSDRYVDGCLYDLQADPYELDNLAGRPEHEPTLRDLRERLKRQMVRAGEAAPKIGPKA